VTTRPAFTAAVAEYVRRHAPHAELVIAEGTGDACKETSEIFRALGYDALARDVGAELVDLNHAPLTVRKDPSRPVFPTMHLPELAFSHCVVSLPVLKAHSLAGVTGTLKNMMGFAPPEHYDGTGGRGGGSWKKAVFHNRMQQSVADLVHYLRPQLSCMDASVGLCSFHLGGPPCSPPAGRILAGFDPFALDRRAAELLGRDWRSIGHLC
jgi:uncharacterized protein (DUF362 family)